MKFTVAYSLERSGTEGFRDAWTAIGGTSAVVAPSELVHTLVQWCGSDRTLAGPQFSALPAALHWPCALAAAATADCAIVEATCAVAQTGRRVFRNGLRDPRRDLGRAGQPLRDLVQFF